MAKKSAGEGVKLNRRADVLKVSKESKIWAAFASLRGINHRTMIKIMGEAEDNYKRYGRLIIGG